MKLVTRAVDSRPQAISISRADEANADFCTCGKQGKEHHAIQYMQTKNRRSSHHLVRVKSHGCMIHHSLHVLPQRHAAAKPHIAGCRVERIDIRPENFLNFDCLRTLGPNYTHNAREQAFCISHLKASHRVRTEQRLLCNTETLSIQFLHTSLCTA